MDDHPEQRDFHVEVGWIIVAVYVASSVITALHYAIGSRPFDQWALVQIGLPAVGGLVTWQLPWAERGPTIIRISLALGTIVSVGMAPILVRDAGMLSVMALAAALCGLSLPWPWLIAYQVPVTTAIVVSLAVDRGSIRDAIATGLYIGAVGFGVGVMGLWLRSRMARADAVADTALETETERARERVAEQEAMARQAAKETEARAALGRSLRAKVEQVASGSQEIDRQSDKITAAIEELAVSLRETAVASEEAATSVEEIAAAAEQGDAQVAELGRAGKEIVGIVDTITELSEQTNLLALNATIEAARAGDAGKGFAVVANEVKDLAQATAKSAANIAQVVADVQRRVTESSEAMSTIAEMVKGLDQSQGMLKHLVVAQSGTVDQITEAVVSEAEGIAAITVAIEEIDREATGLTGATSTPASEQETGATLESVDLATFPRV